MEQQLHGVVQLLKELKFDTCLVERLKRYVTAEFDGVFLYQLLKVSFVKLKHFLLGLDNILEKLMRSSAGLLK